MRTGLLCLGLVLSTLGAGMAYGFSEPEGVPWAEWRFASDFNPAHEIVADRASDPDSLIRRNPATAAVSISAGKVIFTQTGPDDFLRVDVDDLVENGGGAYVNEYTMIFDLKAMDADWLPVYNTGYNNYNAADFWADADGALGSGTYSNPGALPLRTWVRLAVVRRLEGGSWVRDVYVDGKKVLDNLGAEVLDDNSSLYTNAQQSAGQFTILSDSDATAYAGCELDNFAFVAAALSDEEIADLGAYSTRGIFGIMGLASEPTPADEATDVPHDTDLSWTPAETARTHDVYFGRSRDDVNDAGRADAMDALVSQDQTGTVFDPGPLEFGRTYFWRIDEVNGAPDNTVFKGEVWSFTTEPFAYPIKNVTATASSSSRADTGPQNTVNGSGLDTDDQHSVELTQMWMSGNAKPHWIQYQFDTVYKLDELWVWNANQIVEGFVGFGAKNVTIQYSTDGATWTTLEGVPEFSRATGDASYKANTVVDFGGVSAKFVKLTINSNWGGVAQQVSLSEVRFFYVPVQAREPQPADAATDVALTASMNWRPGREATSHQVFFGTDSQVVAAGAVAAGTVTEHSYTPASMTFGTKYFWKVNEVGNAGTYEGDLWSFTAQEFAPIDDFEGYTDDEGQRIYQFWIDGVTNGLSGSMVGYLQAPFAEKTIIHGGKQSMPLAYDNSKSPFVSEASKEFETPENWTGSGATQLCVWTRGYPAVTATAVTETGGKMTLTGAGADIWGNSDECTYAYKTLTGDGSMIARVVSIGPGANTWAKGGVMIRDSLNGGSTQAIMAMTANTDGAAGNGASFQYRATTNGVSANSDSSVAVKAPYWVKIERTGDTLTGYTSADGKAWSPVGTTAITMTDPVQVGLAVTSHVAGENRTYQFESIASTGNVTGAWQGAVINTAQYNDPAAMYLTVQDSAGKTATATSATAATVATWTRWTIPMSSLNGVSFSKIKKLTIGVGTKGGSTAGGTGMVFIDDIGYGRSAQ
jgi:hypothetical protein